MNCECQNLHLPFWATHLFWKAGDVRKLVTLTGLVKRIILFVTMLGTYKFFGGSRNSYPIIVLGRYYFSLHSCWLPVVPMHLTKKNASGCWLDWFTLIPPTCSGWLTNDDVEFSPSFPAILLLRNITVVTWAMVHRHGDTCKWSNRRVIMGFVDVSILATLFLHLSAEPSIIPR